MTEEERKELEELRAYKELKELEALRAYKAQQEAVVVQEQDNRDLTKKVEDDYQKGTSIVNLAYKYKLTIPEILKMTGNEDMLTVTFIGDQIDSTENGYNPAKTVEVKY